jgi:alpha-tubulin suppressor-like RCC1 family protein
LINRNFPVKVSYFLNEKIKDIFVGLDYSAIITENGSIQSWGSNQFGQNGNSNSLKNYIVNLDKNLQLDSQYQISLGFFFGLILICTKQKKEIVFYGYKNTTCFPEPEKIDLNENNIIQISTGNQHSLLKKQNGELLLFGKNYLGECGTENVDYIEKFNKINFPIPVNITQFEAANFFSVAISKYYQIFIWGNVSLIFGLNQG